MWHQMLLTMAALFVVVGRTSMPRGSEDGADDCVAILVDRNFGTWHAQYAQLEGTMVGGSGREPSPKLRGAATYRVMLELANGRVVKVNESFADGISIPDVTDALARSFRQQGVRVEAVPEYGALRVLFTPALRELTVSGGDGFTVEPTSSAERRVQ